MPHQNVERSIVVRGHAQITALAVKPRLGRAVGGRDVAAMMAGLAGVPGVHSHKLPALVLQALGQLAPVAGQYAAVQARLGFDVRARTVLGALSRLGHAAGVQLLSHQGVGLVRQRPADVVCVIGADPFLLASQLGQLAPNPPRPHRSSLLARLLALQAGHLGPQAPHIGHGVHRALAVGCLAYIPIQAQDSLGRAGAHCVHRHHIGEIGIPAGSGARAFLPDPRLPDLPLSIRVAALEPQPTEARHAQVLVPHLDALRYGEPVPPAMSALEARISPRALKEGLVRIRQIFQDIADFAEAVLLQPRVLGITPQGCEFLAQAEEGYAGALLSSTRLVRRVLLLGARHKVIPHKPASSRRAGQPMGHLTALRKQPQPHTAVDGLGLCYIGRSRHGMQSSLSVRER